MWFNSTDVLIQSCTEQLCAYYRRNYGQLRSSNEEMVAWCASMALENIASSDALYHNIEHTILVTLVGQEIVRGKHIRDGGVTPEDWLHFAISHLCHDIGYVKGVCLGDSPATNEFMTGVGDEMVKLPAGATDAALTPYHVDRGKAFVRQRFGNNTFIDAEVIASNMELTRFPVPDSSDHAGTTDFPGLVRAADLIGQLSDPRYLNKIPALFGEFEETGTNKALGYSNPGELRTAYPTFYWKQVYPFIKDALPYLQLTQSGKQIIANLFSNVFTVEHELLDHL